MCFRAFMFVVLNRKTVFDCQLSYARFVTCKSLFCEQFICHVNDTLNPLSAKILVAHCCHQKMNKCFSTN